jgi:hypothetical protein
MIRTQVARKKIEWPMTVERANGGSKTVLVVIEDMPLASACNEAARLVLVAKGYGVIRPFYQEKPID